MPAPRSRALSVVIPTRDRAVLLEACLVALGPELGPDDQLVVADSASTDAAVRRVAESHGATVVREERPGTSRARNAGVRACRHDVVAFIDDDVRVRAGWAAALCAPFDRPDVAFVTGRVTVPAHQLDTQRPVAVKDDTDPTPLDAATPAPLGASANLAVRRSALDAIGGFDEHLGGGARFGAAEDLDVFDRLLAAGYRGWYEPTACVEHDQWRDRRAVLRLDLRYGIGLGARLTKLVRTDRRRARVAAREVVWSDGLVPLWRGVRARHEFEAAAAGLRLLGVLAGLLAGFARPLQGAKFR